MYLTMMQTTKEAKKVKKEKNALKSETNFAYVEKVLQSTNAVAEMLNDYKVKYADRVITAGKALTEGVKTDTSILFEDVVAIGRCSGS